MRHIHSRRLAARTAVYQAEILDQADAAALAVDRAIAALWQQLLEVLRHDHGMQHNYHRALLVLQQFPYAVAGQLASDFRAIFQAGHDSAADATIDVLPLVALRQIAPAIPLFEDDTKPTLPGLVQITPAHGAEPVAKKPTNAQEKEAIKALMFPAPGANEVLRRMGSLVAPAGWQDLGDGGARKMPADLARQMAQSIALGKGQREVAKDILPYFEGSRMRARRTARTFGMLIAHEGRMSAYERMADQIVGYQVHSTHDHHTRPTHAARDGTTYYRHPGPGQLGMDKMPRPPLEADGSIAWNCRCWLTPVLKPLALTPEKQAVFTNAAGKLIPDPVDYSAWFDAAPEDKRAKAIGVRRYYAAKEKLADAGRAPQYADFLDPKTADLLPVATIQDETHAQRAERRTAVDALIVDRQERIREVYTFGFERPAPATPTPTPPPVVVPPKQEHPSKAAAPKKPRDDGIEYVRAPAGGARSDVNGEWYKGGRWMPVHGLSEKKAKPSEGAGPPAAPAKANEDAKQKSLQQRTPRQPMTAEEIEAERLKREQQAKWEEIRSGPIGQFELLHLGERVHHVKNAQPGLRFWMAWADTVSDETLVAIRDIAKQIATKAVLEKEGKPGDEAVAKEYQDYQDEFLAPEHAKYMTKKHVKAKPSSSSALHWFGEAVENGGIEALHRLHQAIIGNEGDANTPPKPSPPTSSTNPIQPTSPLTPTVPPSPPKPPVLVAAGGDAEEPRTFKSDFAARAWGIEHYSKWASTLSPQQSQAIHNYKGAAASIINQVLRGVSDDPIDKLRANELVPHIDAALAKAPLPHPIVAYRDIGDQEVIDAARHLGNKIVGVVFDEKGFFSSSLLKAVAQKKAESTSKVVCKLVAPAGFPAAFIDLLSKKHSWEAELLIARNVRYKIESVKTQSGLLIVTATLL